VETLATDGLVLIETGPNSVFLSNSNYQGFQTFCEATKVEIRWGTLLKVFLKGKKFGTLKTEAEKD
jgi:hypothetical protein